MDTATISLIVFAILILSGGVMGYTKAKSKASLIAGLLSSILLSICAWLAQYNLAASCRSAFILCAVLEGIFMVRLLKTKKFMPSGLMLILSIVEQIILWPNFPH